MSGFYPPPPIPKIVSSAITEDIPCRKCGYNIRGLANDALCPECGAMVSLSTRGDLIRYSDPKWIEKLCRGANWALWAILFTIACGAFDIANASLHLVKPLVPRALLLGQDLFTTAAWWLLTTPDPSGLGEDQYALPRKIMRAAVLARIIQICSNVLTGAASLARPAN